MEIFICVNSLDMFDFVRIYFRVTKLVCEPAKMSLF